MFTSFFIHCINSENRYLLFLTENYAALDILEHYIRGKEQESTMPLGTGLEGAETSTTALKPFTLFGSSFPKDREYTQVCKSILFLQHFMCVCVYNTYVFCVYVSACCVHAIDV